jgi:hypothetical protein
MTNIKVSSNILMNFAIFELTFYKYIIVINAQVVLLKQKKNPLKKNSFCALLS